MGTALTVTFDQPRPKKFARHQGMKSGSIAFANYLTDGNSLDFSAYFKSVQQVVFSDFSAGYAMEYDYTNLKVKVYTSAAGAHVHGLGNGVATLTGDAMVAALTNGTGNTTSNVVGLGNGVLVITGNVASVTAGIQYANSKLEMNAAGGNAALGGNTNTHPHVLVLTGNTSSFTPTGNVALTGSANSATATAGMAELTNSTNMTTILTGVKFVVYGTM